VLARTIVSRSRLTARRSYYNEERSKESQQAREEHHIKGKSRSARVNQQDVRKIKIYLKFAMN
jgi:hypothetical protein